MKKVVIYIDVSDVGKEEVLKRLMDTLDYNYYTYLYNKYLKELLLVTQHGFAIFSIIENYYESQISGREIGYVKIELFTTQNQLPQLAMEVIKILMEIGLYKNAIGFYVNEDSEE